MPVACPCVYTRSSDAPKTDIATLWQRDRNQAKCELTDAPRRFLSGRAMFEVGSAWEVSWSTHCWRRHTHVQPVRLLAGATSCDRPVVEG